MLLVSLKTACKRRTTDNKTIRTSRQSQELVLLNTQTLNFYTSHSHHHSITCNIITLQVLKFPLPVVSHITKSLYLELFLHLQCFRMNGWHFFHIKINNAVFFSLSLQEICYSSATGCCYCGVCVCVLHFAVYNIKSWAIRTLVYWTVRNDLLADVSIICHLSYFNHFYLPKIWH